VARRPLGAAAAAGAGAVDVGGLLGLVAAASDAVALAWTPPSAKVRLVRHFSPVSACASRHSAAAAGRPTHVVEDQQKRKRAASDEEEEEEEEDGDDTDSELYTGRGGGRGRRGRGRGRGRGRKASQREASPDSDVDSQQPAARGRGRGRRGRGRVGRAPGRGRGRGRSAASALTSVEELTYEAPPSAAPTAPAAVSTLGDADRFYPGHGPPQDAIPMPPTAVAEA